MISFIHSESETFTDSYRFPDNQLADARGGG